MRKVDLDRCFDCMLDGNVQVYEISRTGYRQLCERIYGEALRDCPELAPDGDYIVVYARATFGGPVYVRPVYGRSKLVYAVEDVANIVYDLLPLHIRRGIAVDAEIWHVVPDYLLSCVYAASSPEPEQPTCDAVSPVVFATEPDTGKQLVITPDERCARTADALETVMIAISQGYDNVGIVWMRSDWATSQMFASAYLYMLGYSLCNGTADRLGVVTNGRD